MLLAIMLLAGAQPRHFKLPGAVVGVAAFPLLAIKGDRANFANALGAPHPPLARRGIKPTKFKLINFRPVADTALNFKLIPSTNIRDPINPPEITALDVKLTCTFARTDVVRAKLGNIVKVSHYFPPGAPLPLPSCGTLAFLLSLNICIVPGGGYFLNPPVLTTGFWLGIPD